MSSNLHPGSPDPTYKPASLLFHSLEWLKARFQEVMTVADVLHEARWAAPWDDSRSSSAPAKRGG